MRRTALLLLLALSAVAFAQGGTQRVLNKGREGETFVVTDYLSRGKLNIVEFTSTACPSCQALAPKLSALAQRNPEVALGIVVIDRPGSTGIDWHSPLARQYELRSVPYFKVYDVAGKLVAEGEAARKLIAKLLTESQVI